MSDSNSPRKWRHPDARKTVQMRTDKLIHEKKRLRTIIMDELDKKMYHSNKFLKWIWPWDEKDKRDMATDPDRINQRFRDRKKSDHVDVAARFAIDAWFAGDCAPSAIHPGIPELSGRYDKTRQEWVANPRKSAPPMGPPWFKFKKEGYRVNVELISKLPENERHKVCAQLKRDFRDGADVWKPVDIDALWARFVAEHGQPTFADREEWKKVIKKTRMHTKTGAVLVKEHRQHAGDIEAKFKANPETFSATVRRVIYDDALAHKATQWEALLAELRAYYVPIEEGWEIVQNDPFTTWILSHADWANLSSEFAAVSPQDRVIIEALKKKLQEERVKYMDTSFTAKKMRRILQKRIRFVQELKLRNQPNFRGYGLTEAERISAVQAHANRNENKIRRFARLIFNKKTKKSSEPMPVLVHTTRRSPTDDEWMRNFDRFEASYVQGQTASRLWEGLPSLSLPSLSLPSLSGSFSGLLRSRNQSPGVSQQIINRPPAANRGPTSRKTRSASQPRPNVPNFPSLPSMPSMMASPSETGSLRLEPSQLVNRVSLGSNIRRSIFKNTPNSPGPSRRVSKSAAKTARSGPSKTARSGPPRPKSSSSAGPSRRASKSSSGPSRRNVSNTASSRESGEISPARSLSRPGNSNTNRSNARMRSPSPSGYYSSNTNSSATSRK